jgi:hypothetical protein
VRSGTDGLVIDTPQGRLRLVDDADGMLLVADSFGALRALASVARMATAGRATLVGALTAMHVPVRVAVRGEVVGRLGVPPTSTWLTSWLALPPMQLSLWALLRALVRGRSTARAVAR